MSDTKGRLLFLEHYLMEHTDENHMITTDEMIRIYEEHGFKANRNTIRDDIAVLQASDVDVISERVGNGKGYYICGRQFELAELKTLVDAVTSSRFISKRKSEELIQKIAGLTNEQNREHLTARTFTADRIKPETLGTFITVDTIAAAIEQGKKISFQYIDYLPTKEVVLRHDGKVYVASPYCFLWNDDRYYVLSYSEEKGCVVAFRIDRMRNVAVSEEDAVKDESFNPSEYSRTVLKMFDGNLEEREVMLVAENKLMLNVLDRFGEDIETTIVDDQHFRAFVRVRPSATFFSWVFQFSGQIMIAGPADVKQTYELMLDGGCESFLLIQNNLDAAVIGAYAKKYGEVKEQVDFYWLDDSVQEIELEENTVTIHWLDGETSVVEMEFAGAQFKPSCYSDFYNAFLDRIRSGKKKNKHKNLMGLKEALAVCR